RGDHRGMWSPSSTGRVRCPVRRRRRKKREEDVGDPTARGNLLDGLLDNPVEEDVPITLGRSLLNSTPPHCVGGGRHDAAKHARMPLRSSGGDENGRLLRDACITFRTASAIF